MSEHIAIVDAADTIIGSEEQKLARQKGHIHRMVKVIIFNPAGEGYLEAALRETK
jgi:isopentenyldiphosphate isomerase